MSGGATLNLVDLGLAEIPPERLAGAEAFGTLNLSENRLASPAGLAAFSRVHTLVLDKNGLRGCAGFPTLPAVTTLWFNNNEVADVVGFLDEVARAFPAVSYLSCVCLRAARAARAARVRRVRHAHGARAAGTGSRARRLRTATAQAVLLGGQHTVRPARGGCHSSTAAARLFADSTKR